MTVSPWSEAEFYELLHTGTPGDVDFYLRAAAGAQRILELGSGAGRISLELLRAGFEVTAVELHPDLDARARREAEARGLRPDGFIQGDMTRFSSTEKFDRVFVPYNTLFCVPGQAARRAFLERILGLLAPGGELWLDVYVLDDFHEGAEAGEVSLEPEEPETVANLDVGGVAVTVTEQTDVDLDSRRLVARYQAFADDGVRGSLDVTHHYALSSELFEELVQAGFEIDAVFGSFSGASFDGDSEVLILGATKAS